MVTGTMIWPNTIENLAKEASALNKDFVECGSYLGNSAKLLATHCKKTVHLFDSWEGISELTEFDGESYKTEKWICTLEETQKRLSDFKNIEYYKGWFPDRFNEFTGEIGLLHIDASLYHPTKMALEYFYDKVVDGGYIVCNFHEGYSTGAEKAVREFFTEELLEYPVGIRVFIKGGKNG